MPSAILRISELSLATLHNMWYKKVPTFCNVDKKQMNREEGKEVERRRVIKEGEADSDEEEEMGKRDEEEKSHFFLGKLLLR